MNIEEKRELQAMYMAFKFNLCCKCAPLVVKMADEKQCVTLFKSDGKNVGFIIVINGYVEGIYVKDEYRRHGIARSGIVQHVKKYGMPEMVHIINSDEDGKGFWNKFFKLQPIKRNPVETLYKINGWKNTLNQI